MYLRRNFNSSGLVRLLGRWAPADADASRQDIAERLGLWVGVSDAITLDAAHRSIRSLATTKRPVARATRPFAVDDEFRRVRASLVQDIMAGEASGAGDRRARNGVSQPAVAAASGLAYGPYRTWYLDRQRHMESRIAVLRARVRQALAGAAPELAQLATLDAAMDRMLADRAQKLLSTVPQLLERRFEQLRKAHQTASSFAPQPLGMAPGQPADNWQGVFAGELQQALLAELDHRLQPVAGLVEAFNNVYTKSP